MEEREGTGLLKKRHGSLINKCAILRDIMVAIFFLSGVTGWGISVFVRDYIISIKVEKHSIINELFGDQLFALIAIYKPPSA